MTRNHPTEALRRQTDEGAPRVLKTSPSGEGDTPEPADRELLAAALYCR